MSEPCDVIRVLRGGMLLQNYNFFYYFISTDIYELMDRKKRCSADQMRFNIGPASATSDIFGDGCQLLCHISNDVIAG